MAKAQFTEGTCPGCGRGPFRMLQVHMGKMSCRDPKPRTARAAFARWTAGTGSRDEFAALLAPFERRTMV